MTPRPTLGDRIRDALVTAAERPVPVLIALFIGLAAGLIIRDATSSGGGSNGTSHHAARTARQSPGATSPSPSPSPKQALPPASATKESNNATEQVATALAAVSNYASKQEVKVGVAIIPVDGSLPPQSAGSVDRGKPWSTMKVPAAAAYLDFKRESANAASGEETIPPGSTPREDLGNALVNSDNLAIRHRIQEMIRSQGPTWTAEAINAMLEQGGAHAQISPEIDPSINSLEIGTGEWTLDEAARWFRQLQAGCLDLAPQDRSFLLKQLRAAPEALHWGAATVLDDGHIALKPGWGSEGNSYTVEQAVIVGNGAEDEGEGFPSLEGSYVMVLMAVLPSSDPSAFTEGQAQLSELAKLVTDRMDSPGPNPEVEQSSPC